MPESQGQMSRTPSRKRLLVNPRFQALFALYAIGTTLLMVPIFIAANFYFFHIFFSKARLVGLPPDHELLQFVERQQMLMIAVFFGLTILAVLVNVVFSYIVSNRIAGSLYRLLTIMNQVTDIEGARKIQPRKWDCFQDLYKAYNQLVDRLKS